jgi:hypothetical protein
MKTRGDRLGSALVLTCLSGFALKIGFELVTGRTVFVTAMGANIVGVPLAHLVGAAVGAASSQARPPRLRWERTRTRQRR